MYYIENGKRKDPLFAYAPYKYRVSVDAYQSLKHAKYYTLGVDIPFIANTPYRLNTFALLDENPNSMYFGIGEDSLDGLSYYDRNNRKNQKIFNAGYEERQRNLSYRRDSTIQNELPVVTDLKYNEFEASNNLWSFNLDRTFWGKFRFLTGLDFNRVRVKPYDGKWFVSGDPVFGETAFAPINSQIPTPRQKLSLLRMLREKKSSGQTAGK